jgi:hypothetical protein
VAYPYLLITTFVPLADPEFFLDRHSSRRGRFGCQVVRHPHNNSLFVTRELIPKSFSSRPLFSTRLSYLTPPHSFLGDCHILRLRDQMGIINSSSEINSLAESEPTSGGVYFVTAFSGLLAPYWDTSAGGMLIGASFYCFPFLLDFDSRLFSRQA